MTAAKKWQALGEMRRGKKRFECVNGNYCFSVKAKAKYQIYTKSA